MLPFMSGSKICVGRRQRDEIMGGSQHMAGGRERRLTIPAQSPCGAIPTRMTTISSALSDSAMALSFCANSIVALHS